MPFPLTHMHKLETFSVSSVVLYLTTDSKSTCDLASLEADTDVNLSFDLGWPWPDNTDNPTITHFSIHPKPQKVF